jgi:HD superfamily phosphodiesterase
LGIVLPLHGNKVYKNEEGIYRFHAFSYMKKTLAPIFPTQIIKQTEGYVRQLLFDKLPPAILFHTVSHTLQVVKAAEKIGRKSGLSMNDIELVVLAAWLHDTGYCFNALNHEQESIRLARSFLSEKNYPLNQIEQISACIAATKFPQQLQSLLEQVVCDADLAHLSEKGFHKRSELLRKETSMLTGQEITKSEWSEENILLLKSHLFFTSYSRHFLASGQEKNYRKVKKKSRLVDKRIALKEDTGKMAASQYGEEKEGFANPARGIETMFRTASHNHLELSAIADNKANIMITINSINISLIISLLLRRLEAFPNLVIPTAILTLVSLLSIVFAVLATRPIITSGMFSREDILGKRTNLLFFGNFHHMPLDEYEWGIRQLMQSSDMLYSNLIHDIHSIGKVLGSKYHMLRICYSVFMYGIILSILSYAIAFIFFPVA